MMTLWPLPGAIPSSEEKPAFDKGPFDFIFSSHCLEHIAAWEDELRKWEAHLKPGGTMFLYLPHPAMRKWRPGGEWCGSWHKWSPEPLALVKWLNENTSMSVLKYDPHPDMYWSFWIAATK